MLQEKLTMNKLLWNSGLTQQSISKLYPVDNNNWL